MTGTSIHPLSLPVSGGKHKTEAKMRNEFVLTHPLAATIATSPNSTATVTTSTSTTSNNITTVAGVLGFKPYGIAGGGGGGGCGGNRMQSDSSHSYNHRKPLSNYASDSIELERDVLI